jgi:hypothetical protein
MSSPLDFGNNDADDAADLERELPEAPTHKPIAVKEDDMKKLIGLTNCARGEARSALYKNDHNVSFALIDIASAKEHASFSSTPSKKPSAAGSSKTTTPAKSSSAKKRPCEMTPEEHKAYRRPMNREYQRRCRARKKERQRILEERLERASAIMSPAQKKQMMLGEYTDVAQTTASSVEGMVEVAKKLANLNEDVFATLDDEEAQGVAYDSESDANNDNVTP